MRDDVRYSGYISRRHWLYKDDRYGRTYKHLSTADYWSLPWFLSLSECHIVCVHSEQLVAPDSVDETPANCTEIFAEGYTYIKLEVGQLRHLGRRVEALRPHHITLCYAAPMTDAD